MEIEQVVNDTNKVLRYLRDNAEYEWKDIIASVLTESEYETNLTTIDRAMKVQDLEDVYGAIAVGTGTLIEKVGLDVADGRLAIKILKDSGRIVQCGRGRGKAVIVLHTLTIDANTVKGTIKDAPAKQVEVQAPTVTPAPVITTETQEQPNVSELLNEAVNSFNSMQARVAELEEVVEQKDGEISSLKAELAEAQQKLDTQHLTSWT